MHLVEPNQFTTLETVTYTVKYLEGMEWREWARNLDSEAKALDSIKTRIRDKFKDGYYDYNPPWMIQKNVTTSSPVRLLKCNMKIEDMEQVTVPVVQNCA